MQRVHDLDGDVFAMPPYIHTRDDIDTDGNPQWIYKPTVPPAVGDVIRNTRTADYWVDEGGWPDVWADPPFLRVVELWPIQDESPYMTGTVWAKNDGTFWLIAAQHDPMEPPEGLPIRDLHGGQPGGWAIRVKARACPQCGRTDTGRGQVWANGRYHRCPVCCSSPPTGRPLNHCEERPHR